MRVFVLFLLLAATSAIADEGRVSIQIPVDQSEILAKRIRGAGWRCPAATKLYRASDDGDGFDLRVCCGPQAGAEAINATQCYRLFLPRQGTGSVTPWRR